MSKITFISILVLISITILVVVKETKKDSKDIFLKESSVILAFGDSLTYGFGADYESSYPKYLERKTGLKVINAGINGEISSEGLIRLPDFLESKPDLVILCHGGNDILNKLSSSELKENLLAMIELIQKSGAKVLFVAVPDFSLLNFSKDSLYEEIANETEVLYEDEVLMHIQLNRALKSDYVHPNEKGYELMADAFIEVLNI